MLLNLLNLLLQLTSSIIPDERNIAQTSQMDMEVRTTRSDVCDDFDIDLSLTPDFSFSLDVSSNCPEIQRLIENLENKLSED